METEGSKKTTTWHEIFAKIKARDKKFKGKTEKIDHDLIAHGVSRDGTTLENKKKNKRKKVG